MEVIEACVSVHYPVLFESECFSPSPTFAQHSHWSRVNNSNTANLFSEHYSLYVTNDILNETESLIEGFYKVCSTSLDTVAPLKHKRVKGVDQPWLNETTHALRQECRKAKRKWKSGILLD